MLEALIEIVRRAGDMVLSAHDIQNVTREKHGPADLVTQYDEAVQAARSLQKHTQSCGIFSVFGG